MGFFEDYFVNPVSMHSGYNIVNTAFYAVVAIAMSYALFKLFERLHVAIDWKFFAGLLPFVLLGSTLRTITDSINYGIMDGYLGAPFFGQLYQLIKASHLYDYGFLTVSPGIYLVTASIFLASFLALYFAKKLEWLPYVGLGLWLPNLLVLAGMFRNFGYAALALAFWAVPTLLAYVLAKKYKQSSFLVLPIAAQALDGAATFTMMDIYAKATGANIGTLALATTFLGSLGAGYLVFFAAKVLIAAAVVYLLAKEKGLKENERNYIALLVTVAGLAPGLHDLLQLLIAG